MTEQEIKDLVTRQRSDFQSGATLPVSARVAALRRTDGKSRHKRFSPFKIMEKQGNQPWRFPQKRGTGFH